MLKPIKDLKAAINARMAAGETPSSASHSAPNSAAAQPSSSGQEHLASSASAIAAPFQLVAATPTHQTPSSGHRGRSRLEERTIAVEDSDEEVPLAQQRGSSSSKASGAAAKETHIAPATSPVIMLDAARPAPTFNGYPHPARNTSAPQVQPTPPTSPSRQPSPPREQEMIDEINDIPPEFFSSPVAGPSRMPRAESSNRQMRGSSQALAGPGPSTQAQATQAKLRAQRSPSPVAPQIQHPWSKEVEQKLRQVFNLPKFRHHQKEAIDVTMAGKDGEQVFPSSSYRDHGGIANAQSLF